MSLVKKSLFSVSAAAASGVVLIVVEVWRRWRRERAAWRALCEAPPALRYGTAGFRGEASLLRVAMVRVGMVAALRGDSTGVMVTASHNPVRDNGCKIVESSGEMLAAEWESKAEKVANAAESRLVEVLSQEFPPQKTTQKKKKKTVVVVVGRDTRPHSKTLARLVRRGAERCGARVLDVGVVTTPQLHHCVVARTEGVSDECLLRQYASALAANFTQAIQGTTACDEKARSSLTVDCAGGVGFLALRELETRLRGVFEFSAINAPNEVTLNLKCGAEFVQKHRKPPLNITAETSKSGCSIDGDADRLVYWYFSSSRKGKSTEFRVVDGDKIAALLADFWLKHMKKKESSSSSLGVSKYTVGVVQTAYANGASTRFLKSRGARIAVAKTGVKHLHKAAKAFDVGVYFEANGHGTVLFSPRFAARLSAIADASLRAVASLASPHVGDALADALLVEAVLRRENLDISQWDALYEDLPSRMLAQTVRDRTVLVPRFDETRLVEPIELQTAIDRLVAQYAPTGRAFVRPSGTEDVVRIYAEATTQDQADALARQVAVAVYDCAAGVGPRP